MCITTQLLSDAIDCGMSLLICVLCLLIYLLIEVYCLGYDSVQLVDRRKPLPHYSTLKMEIVGFFETLVPICHTVRHIAKDSDLHCN